MHSLTAPEGAPSPVPAEGPPGAGSSEAAGRHGRGRSFRSITALNRQGNRRHLHEAVEAAMPSGPNRTGSRRRSSALRTLLDGAVRRLKRPRRPPAGKIRSGDHAAFFPGPLRRAGRILLAALLLATAGNALPATAQQAHASTFVYTVADDSFAPEGYDWFMEFTGVQPVSGWQAMDDLTKGMGNGPNYSSCVQPGQNGYVAYVDESNQGQPFELRLTGGTYHEQAVDAVLCLTHWEFSNGTQVTAPFVSEVNLELMCSLPSRGGMAPRGAVYYNPHWTSDSSRSWRPEALNNLNFFSVGLKDFTVQVHFVKAGTDEPVRVKGHMTCIDLDSYQSFSFGGGVVRAEISESAASFCPGSNDEDLATGKANWLNIVERGTKVSSNSLGIDATDADKNYQKGLVGTYFDTGERGIDALVLSFFTLWNHRYQTTGYYGSEPAAFFAMTPEYIANPPLTDGAGASVSKTMDSPNPVDAGGEVHWTVNVTLPREGIDVRTGYELPQLVITDSIPDNMVYKADSATISMDGSPLPASAGAFTCYRDDDGSWKLEYRFSKDYLKDFRTRGQKLTLGLVTVAQPYPSQWNETRLPLINRAQVDIIGNPAVSNDAYNEMIAPRKTINGSTETVEGIGLGDTVTYRIEQAVHDEDVDGLGPYGRFELSDELPPYVEYVDGSFAVYDSEGKPVPAGAGTFGYDRASNRLSYRFNESYLDSGMIYNGHSYCFSFEARAVDQPDDDLVTVDNSATVTVNGVTRPTNIVSYKPVSPVLTIEKHADLASKLASAINDFEYLCYDCHPQSHSIVRFEGSFSNTTDKTRAKNVVMADILPQGLTLVPGSAKVEGPAGTVVAEDAEANCLSVTVPSLDAWDKVTFSYECRTAEAGNGTETVNTARVCASNVTLGLPGAEDSPAADDGEIYINDPAIQVVKALSPSPIQNGDYTRGQEFRVGDEFTYSVTVANTAPGTFARNLILLDDTLPSGLQAIGSPQVSSLDANGRPKTIFYPISGTSDSIHGEGATREIQWTVKPLEDALLGTWGWELDVDYLPANYPVTVTWKVRATETVNGWEIANRAHATAENQPGDEFWSNEVIAWINSPEFTLDKSILKTDAAYNVGDTVGYNVELGALKTPGTVARHTVLCDAFDNEGTSILEKSFVVTASPDEGTDMSSAVNFNRHVGEQRWTVEASQVFSDPWGYWVNDEPYLLWDNGVLVEQAAKNPLGVEGRSYLNVRYDALINDMALQNDSVNNRARAKSDEGLPVEDEAAITVTGPQLDIEKTSNDGGSFVAGDVADYELTVRNLATGTVAENVRITDRFTTAKAGAAAIVDGSVRLIDDKGAGLEGWDISYTDNEAGDHIGFSLDTHRTLESGAKLIVRYQVKYLTDNGSAVFVNRATASADNAPETEDTYETWPGDNHRSDLIVTKGSDKRYYLPGETALYTLHVTNKNAAEPARFITVNDQLKAPASQWASIIGGSVRVYDENGDAVAAQTIYRRAANGAMDGFTLEADRTLESTQELIIQYEVALSEGIDDLITIHNDCWAAAANTGRAVDDNDIYADGNIRDLEDPGNPDKPDDPGAAVPGKPALALNKTADCLSASPGDPIGYTITAVLFEDVTGLVITDDLPEGLTLLPGSLRVFVNDEDRSLPVGTDGSRITAVIGDASADDEISLRFTAFVDESALPGDRLVNRAEAVADGIDPVGAQAVTDVVDDATLPGTGTEPYSPYDTVDYKGIPRTGDELILWLMENWPWAVVAAAVAALSLAGIPRLAASGSRGSILRKP